MAPAATLTCLLSPWLQDSEKRTPLHVAAFLGDAEIIELLILSGKCQLCIQSPHVTVCDPLTLVTTLRNANTVSSWGSMKCLRLVILSVNV